MAWFESENPSREDSPLMSANQSRSDNIDPANKKENRLVTIFKWIYRILSPILWIIMLYLAHVQWQYIDKICRADNDDAIQCSKMLRANNWGVFFQLGLSVFLFILPTIWAIHSWKWLKLAAIVTFVFTMVYWAKHAVFAVYKWNNDFTSVFSRYFIIGFILIYLLILVTCIFFAKVHWIGGIISLLVISILMLIFYYQKFYTSCETFYLGLSGSKMDNNKGWCKYMDQPKYCDFGILSNSFNLALYGYSDCKKIADDYAHVKMVCKNCDIAAFKNVGSYDSYTLQHDHYLHEKNIENIKAVTEEEMNKGWDQVFVDFRSNKNGELKVQLKKQPVVQAQRDQIRIQDEAAIAAGQAQKKPKNIIHLFMDATSRAHAFRKWPLTIQWLEKYYKSDLETSEIGAYQFFKLHSIRGYTFPNLIAGLYGNYDDAYDIKMKRLDSFYREAGYMTAFTNNMCEVIEVLRQNDAKSMPYVDPIWPDHIMTEVACDLNSHNSTQTRSPFNFGSDKGPFSAFRNCVNGKDSAAFNFQWARQYLDAYSSSRKFLTVRLIDGHEFTGEVVKYVDRHYRDFLEWMRTNGHLSDAILMMTADHGNHMNYQISDLSKDGNLEEMTPLFFLVASKQWRKQFDKNLMENESRMVTYYDIHNSFLRLVQQKYMDKGQSFLHEVIKENKDCKGSGIKENCQCVNEKDFVNED